MKTLSFHHPDICPKLIARYACDELLDSLVVLGALLASNGRAINWGFLFPSDSSYRSALSRLRKKGLLVTPPRDGGAMRVELTSAGKKRTPPWLQPEKYWNRTWSSRWNVLMYDVPEKQRAYRSVLCRFIKGLRMGCLQRSVWITPDDIRDIYADMRKGMELDLYAVLFEARMVLGMEPAMLVEKAWPFEQIRERQRRYQKVFRTNQKNLVEAKHISRNQLQTLIQEEAIAYRTVMYDDPLLPRSLWPSGYQGYNAWELHVDFCKSVAWKFSK